MNIRRRYFVTIHQFVMTTVELYVRGVFTIAVFQQQIMYNKKGGTELVIWGWGIDCHLE